MSQDQDTDQADKKARELEAILEVLNAQAPALRANGIIALKWNGLEVALLEIRPELNIPPGNPHTDPSLANFGIKAGGAIPGLRKKS